MNGETAGLKKYASVEQGLRAMRYSLRNDELIKRFSTAVGIEAFYETSGYIKAVRRDGGPDLRIYRGSTNGFTSEEEVVAMCGDAPRRRSLERPGLWRVIHPDDPGDRESGPKSGRTPHRIGGLCPECFSELASNGRCTNAICSGGD